MPAMSPKAFSPFENENPRIEEIRTYLRWSRRLFYASLTVLFVNLILTYGLIFHPSKISVETCAKYLPSIQASETADDVSHGLILSRSSEITELEAKGMDSVARSITTDLSEIDPRWDYGNVRTEVALAMGGVWVTAQAIAWWNMVSACQDVGSGASNTINCVWGAVSTIITASGAIYTLSENIGHISTFMRNNGISIGNFKRSGQPSQELLDELSTVFGTSVTHLGHWNCSLTANDGSIDAHDVQTSLLDVFGFNNNGMDMHFSYLGNQTNGPTFRFGLGMPTSSNSNMTSRGLRTAKEKYDTQYFSSGGIDFVVHENPDHFKYPKGAALDPKTDYSWIYDQVSCIMASGMTAAGHYFEIYDNRHETTLAAGAVAPFAASNHWSAITQMEAGKGGLLTTPKCDQDLEKSKAKREFHA